MGLGLTVAADIVARHDGRIEVDSAPGRTAFKILLPIDPEETPMSARILLADDDASLRFVLSQALGKEGYDVRATGNVATLAKWVRDGEGDLVLSDVYMGDDCVFDALPGMRAARPTLPVIVMSAQSTVATALSRRRRRRLRLRAEAVRSRRPDGGGAPRARRRARREDARASVQGREGRAPAADRPLGGDAGRLSRRWRALRAPTSPC